MSVLVGKKAPKFSAPAVINGTQIVENFSLDQFIGKNHVIFFFYPKDFTFVCPTELHAFQERIEEFEKRGVKIVACSTDTEESHFSWLQLPKEQGGIKGVRYTLVADTTKTISTNYGVLFGNYDYTDSGELSSNGPMIAFRGLFLINKEGIVMHQLINHFPLGRSVDETLRMIDALQHHEEYGEVCPANWVKGEEAMMETPNSVAEYLSKR